VRGSTLESSSERRETTSPRATRLLIVIPTFNEAAHISEVLTFLLIESAEYDAEIIVADGGSSDDTRIIVDAHRMTSANIHLVVNGLKIQSAGVNLAVLKHGHDRDLLLRIDAHGSYRPGFLKHLVDEMTSCGAESVVVSMHAVGANRPQRSIAAVQNSRLGNGGSSHRNSAVAGKWVDHGHHALIDLESFRHLGGYDEAFSHNEDAEFDVRLLLSGGSIWLTGAATFEYFPRGTLRALAKQYYYFGRGRAKTAVKHTRLPHLRQMVLLPVVPAIIIAAGGIFWIWLAVPALVWLVPCVVYAVVLRRGSRAVSTRTVLSAAVVMHFSWSAGFWRQLCAEIGLRLRRSKWCGKSSVELEASEIGGAS
jgi:succinoglycan biosynthesis protein ExoA